MLNPQVRASYYVILHYKSHVDDGYKRALLKTMLDRAFRLKLVFFSTEIS